MLLKFGIRNTDRCTFCKNEIETIEHILVKCQFSDTFWNELEMYISQKLCRPVKFSIQDKLFGSLQEDKTINHILTLARKHMYYSKLNELKPNMDDFLHYLRNIIKLEKFSAQLNQSPHRYTEKWKYFM